MRRRDSRSSKHPRRALTTVYPYVGHARTYLRRLAVEPLECRWLLNAAPTASADAYSVGERDVYSESAPGLLANDTDPDDDPIEIIDVETRETEVLAAQTVFFAAGRFPELIFTRVKPEIEEGAEEDDDIYTGPLKWVAREPYKRPDIKDEIGFFSRGDAFTDHHAAIKAIGAGRRVAASIHQIMYGIEPELSDNVLQPDSKIQNIHKLTADDVKSSSRTIMPLRSEKQAGDEKELETGFDENMARREAGRCLRCGLICYMHKPQKKSKAA